MSADSALDIEVRQLLAHEDLDQGVRLQRRVWGETYRDAVPASLLKISQKVGGLAAGAFLESGEMVGFVCGLTGVDAERRIIHWSHMLAVLPAYRNHGIGRRLKFFQREHLRGRGVERMYWTFDPLVARNAHLNLNRLGVRLVEYVPDMYADTGSDLHAFGTDRFIAEWPVNGGSARAAAGVPMAETAIAGAASAPVHDGSDSLNGDHPALVRVEIPADAESMRTDSLPELRRWRAATRRAFVDLMRAGYGISGFYRDGGRSFYVLSRPGLT
jgi:predicted GNAT superfamily acetyltransferase